MSPEQMDQIDQKGLALVATIADALTAGHTYRDLCALVIAHSLLPDMMAKELEGTVGQGEIEAGLAKCIFALADAMAAERINRS